MSYISIPGVCIVCRAPVVWNGRVWRGPGRGRAGRHYCRPERCNAWMPNARERCARFPDHGQEHRTEYALQNARYMATGRRYNARVEVSDTPHNMSRSGSRLPRLSRTGSLSRVR